MADIITLLPSQHSHVSASLIFVVCIGSRCSRACIMDLHYQPINGQCRAGFVVLLHQKCKTKTKERQTTSFQGRKLQSGRDNGTGVAQIGVAKP